MDYHNFLVITGLLLCSVSISSIHIENNAYEKISISFSESLHEQRFDFEKLKAVLAKSSDFLYHATRKRSYFGGFVLSLPLAWTGDMCTEFTNEDPGKVDIHITDSTDQLDLRAKHSKGCGSEGDIMYMPLRWLEGRTEDLAHQFLQQWSIYRYGVFEEDPIKEGSCYMSRNSWSPTGCYNVKVEAEATFENGLPVCYLPSDFFEQNELKSSLMSKSNSSKTMDFCDGSDSFPHNPIMATLHNNLCEGKTVWSVIEHSNDFKYARNLPMKNDTPPSSPAYKCFKEEPLQVTFAIQNSTTKKDLSTSMDELGSSLYQFLWNMAPPKSKANVVMFSDNEDSSKSLELDLTNSKALSTAINFCVKTVKVLTKTNTCLPCGLQKALNASQTHAHSSPLVVLIAWESSLIGEKPSQLVELIQSYTPSNVRLHLVLVEDTEPEVLPSALVDAVRSTGGNIYSLPKELVFMASKLHVILAGIFKNPLQLEDRIVVVHEANYKKITENFIDSFSVSNVAVGKLVYNMYCDITRPILQENPNCTFSTSLSKTAVCGEVVELNDQTGSIMNWKYSFAYEGSTEPPNCSSVAMLLVSSSSKNSFTLRGWLHEYQIKVGQNALVVYAEITGSFEKSFRVHAQISGPGLKSPFTIPLRDNGNGDPDVKAGDGIYSRYFTSFSKKGNYIVSVSAELLSNEDSDIFSAEGNQYSVQNIVQKKIIGSFSVIEDAPDIDILPPNRIGDLSVVSINHENNTVTLQWTAPGNDYDFGTATTYEIKYSAHSASLLDLYFNEEGNIPMKPIHSLTPSQDGTIEVLEFHSPEIKDDSLYYVALRAIDLSGNKGRISNVVQVYLNQSQNIVIVHTSTTGITNLGSTASSVSTEFQNTTNDVTNITVQTPTGYPEVSETTSDGNGTGITPIPPTNEKFFDEKLIIVTSSAGGILLLIIIINIIVCYCCIKRKKHYQDSKKLSRKSSLRPPYNLNIAFQDESNSSIQTDNDTGVPMTALENRNIYSEPHARRRAIPQGYTYHTDKSLQNNAKSQKNSELGFKLVQALPAYATSSLSRYATKLNEDESDIELEVKSAVAQPQEPSSVNDTHIYTLGVV